MQTLLGTLEKQLIGNALRRPSYGRLSVNGMNPSQAYDQIKFSFVQRDYLRDIREGLTELFSVVVRVLPLPGVYGVGHVVDHHLRLIINKLHNERWSCKDAHKGTVEMDSLVTNLAQVNGSKDQLESSVRDYFNIISK